MEGFLLAESLLLRLAKGQEPSVLKKRTFFIPFGIEEKKCVFFYGDCLHCGRLSRRRRNEDALKRTRVDLRAEG